MKASRFILLNIIYVVGQNKECKMGGNVTGLGRREIGLHTGLWWGCLKKDNTRKTQAYVGK